MKKRLLSILMSVALLCMLLAVSGFASASAHAASTASAVTNNNCESDGQAVGLYTISQITICDVGNGYTQVHVDAYGGCIFSVSITVVYQGGQNSQGNVTGQPCTNWYGHLFPSQHRTGHVYVGAIVTITEFGATETTYPDANIWD